MENREHLLCLGKMYETSIGWDYFDPIRVRFCVVIDHEVDGDKIREAWERTKRVYPLLDAVPAFEHGFGVFLDPETKMEHMSDEVYLDRPQSGSSEPQKSSVPLSPWKEATGGRLVSVTYYKDTITICSYHSFMDAGGVLKVLQTLLYSYFVLQSGKEDENPVVELSEGREISDYYTVDVRDVIYPAEYTPQPIYSLPEGCRGFMDADMRNEEKIHARNLHIPVEEFMNYCRANRLNPTALLSAVASRAAYTVHPEERRDVVMSMTVSLKKFFARENDISNSLGLAHTYATYEECSGKELAAVAGRMRGEIKQQLTADYSASFYRFIDNYQRITSKPLFEGRVITYVGAVNIGENNHHLLDIRMETNSSNVINMIQLNDRFSLMILYGKATDAYLKAIESIFREIGIHVEINPDVDRLLRGADAPVP